MYETIRRNMKLLFESPFLPLSPLPEDPAPQRVPNVPSDFLSTKHRCLGPQSIG